jgi:hypothetical protein
MWQAGWCTATGGRITGVHWTAYMQDQYILTAWKHCTLIRNWRRWTMFTARWTRMKEEEEEEEDLFDEVGVDSTFMFEWGQHCRQRASCLPMYVLCKLWALQLELPNCMILQCTCMPIMPHMLPAL